MKLRWFAFLIVLLAGCSSKHDYTNPPWNAKVPVQRAMQWMPISQKAGAASRRSTIDHGDYRYRIGW